MALATKLAALERELEHLLAAWGYELVLLRYANRRNGGWLQLLIDKPGGVTVDDCGQVSQQVGAYLDVVDPIPNKYVLEVSSPGVNRPLTKEKDWQGNVGRRVRLRLSSKQVGRKRVEGVLKAVGKDVLEMEVDGQVLVVAREGIEEARLRYDWQEEERSARRSEGKREERTVGASRERRG